MSKWIGAKHQPGKFCRVCGFQLVNEFRNGVQNGPAGAFRRAGKPYKMRHNRDETGSLQIIWPANR
jgi:hypothetical protein